MTCKSRAVAARRAGRCPPAHVARRDAVLAVRAGPPGAWSLLRSRDLQRSESAMSLCVVATCRAIVKVRASGPGGSCRCRGTRCSSQPAHSPHEPGGAGTRCATRQIGRPARTISRGERLSRTGRTYSRHVGYGSTRTARAGGRVPAGGPTSSRRSGGGRGRLTVPAAVPGSGAGGRRGPGRTAVPDRRAMPWWDVLDGR